MKYFFSDIITGHLLTAEKKNAPKKYLVHIFKYRKYYLKIFKNGIYKKKENSSNVQA